MYRVLLFTILISSLAPGKDQEYILRRKLGAELQVTTFVREQKTCLGDSGLRVDLMLRLKYTNNGKYPIILDKESGDIGGGMIYHTKRKALSGKFEYNWHQHIEIIYPSGKEESVPKLGDTPSESFAILKPGESYENESGTFLLFDSLRRYRHYSAADHFIRFAVYTGLHVVGNADELRDRWQKYGYLWAEGATSRPMRIELVKARNLKRCEN